ncbi:hypothetical protein ACLEDY_07390 [Lonsdalea quercina]|uniref:hypothetical protein n=1 Tax=Lonsdalea quercina TaxID=71657 RepID=UPI003976DED1
MRDETSGDVGDIGSPGEMLREPFVFQIGNTAVKRFHRANPVRPRTLFVHSLPLTSAGSAFAEVQGIAARHFITLRYGLPLVWAKLTLIRQAFTPFAVSFGV